jgi:hypothetical protein
MPVNGVVWILDKQWPLAPNLPEWRITRANVLRRVTFFSKKPFGECGRVWRVQAKKVGECRRMYRVRPKQVGEFRRMYRVRPKQVGECRQVWRVLAKPRQMLAHDKIGHFKHK